MRYAVSCQHPDLSGQTIEPEHNIADTYPVLTLPPEVVSEIFVNFLPSYPERPPPSGMFSPILLCQVCRHWRDIALSTPPLWRAIDLDLQPTKSMHWMLHVLRTWLLRSGDCPLAISLRYPAHFHEPRAPDLHLSEFLYALLPHIKRLEHLELIMPFEHLHAIQGDIEMPLLRHLTFGPSDLPPDADEPEYAVLTLFANAPQLAHVVLADCFVPARLFLPWAQLTHLEGCCLYEQECMAILCAADCLVECTLTVCGLPDYRLPIPAAPPQPHLRRLTLLCTQSSDANHTAVLDRVTLPALRTLQIAETGSGAALLRSLEAFIERSGCVLESLRIDMSSLDTNYRAALPSIGTVLCRAACGL
ncbi:hypothetical protein B0H15DRAFT_287330 [Mycena belliarum]|uniref:F-box domain-containing protein n=1 Tax=Mycena belliarum TaxID=1033014 RepID=A0AAD6U359_9AGAR|nr:hypothetical protein B0H15DRAFT_287330 [Mycena belliae]